MTLQGEGVDDWRRWIGSGAADWIAVGSLVFPDVTVEVRLLAETAIAERAAEWSLPVVDVADVALEVRRDAETAPTVPTPVRLLTCVRPQVTGQVRRAGKRLAAVEARVPVNRFRRQQFGDADQR